MTSPPPSPDPKRGFGELLGPKLGKFLSRSRPSSPSTSQQFTIAPASQSRLSPPLPADQISLTPTANSERLSTGIHRVEQEGFPSAHLQVPGVSPVRYGQPVARLSSSTISIASSANTSPSNSSIPATFSSSKTKQASNAVWTGLAASLRAIEQSTAVLPPLRSAIGELISQLDVMEEAAKYRREYEDLASELMSSSKALEQYIRQGVSARMSESVVEAAHAIEEQARFLDSKRSRGGVRRWIEAIAEDQDLMRSYRQIQNSFRKLQTDAAMNAAMIAEEQQMNNRLVALNPAKLAYYDSKLSTGINRRSCTNNTRTGVFSDLDNWSLDPHAVDVYWMNGMAGTGKTTIAFSFSELLEHRHQLAASFFCTRRSAECRDVSRIIPTIVYQLARYSLPFQLALCEELGKDPDASSKAVPVQFERLLRRPLSVVKAALPSELVVVIDALDECEDRNGTRLMMEALFRFATDLPLKFFITSRPEGQIYHTLRSRSWSSLTVLHLHEIETSIVQADIKLYLNEELGSILSNPGQIGELAWRSGSLFIFAAALVQYILPFEQPVDPQRRLRSVLETYSLPRQVHVRIDELYTTVLRGALDENRLDEEEVQNIRSVLRTAVCIREPVRVQTIAILAGLGDPRLAMTALDTLRSVIRVSELNHSEVISFLHESFPQFVFSQERAGVFFCDLVCYNGLLAQRCFDIMKFQLEFNICKLESSFLFDEEVEKLEARVNRSISPALSYACRYWGTHLKLSTNSDALYIMLNDFLTNRLLFWMEVLNFQRSIGLGAQILREARRWLKIDISLSEIAEGGVGESVHEDHSRELPRLLEDAQKFVTAFTLNPVSQSTPHIYVSMLPFWPESSPVAKHYANRIRVPMAPQGSAINRRQAKLLATWGVHSAVNRVTWSPDGAWIILAAGRKIFIQDVVTGRATIRPLQQSESSIQSLGLSPDGALIVSGLANGTIDMWDAQAGSRVLDPFKGHSDWVTAVAFSPNGSCIVSGSRDSTVRMWDAQSGQTVLGPLQGHTDWVTSVAFSPDGTTIVSGSDDKTIRLWEAQSGQAVLGPLEGHTHWITSVAFSHDGTRIISGSWDKTIRVWDVHTGQTVLGPLDGHNELVTSVAFSPDGTCIASGSYDKTIRVWDAQSGKTLLGPLEGHAAWVTSIAFSPDGMRIVSGSGDKTICIWDLQIVLRELDTQPISHAGLVASVAFSPDGTRVVSGSQDKTICTWDARSSRMVQKPYEGHTNSVTSVAFSPDGTCIVSASWDQTIRMWDMQSGQTVLGPLEGHTDLVTSVAFSPDGARIVSGSNDKTIRIWDAQSGQAVLDPLQGHTGCVTSAAFSPDGTSIISGSDDQTICMWSTQSGQIVLGPLKGHQGSVSSIAFSPDGTCILSGSKDNDVRMWDAQSGEAVLTFGGHTDWVTSVAFSPDGSHIISGSYDKTICMWDTRSRQIVLGPLKGHTEPVASVAFSPDGTRIISSSHDQTIRMWDGRIRQTVVLPSSSTVVTPPSWHINTDGWVEDDYRRLLAWVPPDLRHVLLPSQSIWRISAVESVGLTFADDWMGRPWDECYQPG